MKKILIVLALTLMFGCTTKKEDPVNENNEPNQSKPQEMIYLDQAIEVQVFARDEVKYINDNAGNSNTDTYLFYVDSEHQVMLINEILKDAHGKSIINQKINLVNLNTGDITNLQESSFDVELNFVFATRRVGDVIYYVGHDEYGNIHTYSVDLNTLETKIFMLDRVLRFANNQSMYLVDAKSLTKTTDEFPLWKYDFETRTNQIVGDVSLVQVVVNDQIAMFSNGRNYFSAINNEDQFSQYKISSTDYALMNETSRLAATGSDDLVETSFFTYLIVDQYIVFSFDEFHSIYFFDTTIKQLYVNSDFNGSFEEVTNFDNISRIIPVID